LLEGGACLLFSLLALGLAIGGAPAAGIHWVTPPLGYSSARNPLTTSRNPGGLSSGTQ